MSSKVEGHSGLVSDPLLRNLWDDRLAGYAWQASWRTHQPPWGSLGLMSGECLPWVWCGPLVRKLGLGGILGPFQKGCSEKLEGGIARLLGAMKNVMLQVAQNIQAQRTLAPLKSPLLSSSNPRRVRGHPWASKVGRRTEILGEKNLTRFQGLGETSTFNHFLNFDCYILNEGGPFSN